MINIFQRHWYTSTRLNPLISGNATAADQKQIASQLIQSKRAENNEPSPDRQLVAETFYCGTDCEVGARLRVDPISFKIVDATWEVYSLPVTITSIPEICGIEAYFNSGSTISKVLAHLGPLPVALFKETIRGIIQSETFLLKERGYTSAADYNKYWDQFYLNTCRYYSNLDRISKQWDYSDYKRTSILFNRFISQSVYTVPGGSYRVIATFSDSYHELSVELNIEKNMIITKANGMLLRAPSDVCLEANAFLQKLPGYNANNPVKKQIAIVLGQGNGCIHIIDTVFDALVAVNMAANRHEDLANL